MMTYLQRSILAISTALVGLLAVLILRSVSSQSEKVRVAETRLRFDPKSAYEKTKDLATGYPERAMGTEGARAASEWIESEMKELGLRTELQNFTAWVNGERVEGRNVVGTQDGVHEDTIVVVAHYDIPFHVSEGAMDDASGVGVLLELARVLTGEGLEKTLVFVASDGEEWGMLGARHFVKEDPQKKRIVAVVSLDYVRVEDPEKVYLRGEGQFRGYTPQWLWMLASDCVSKAGGKPKAPSPLMHYVSQAVNISSTDQGPFLQEGVPGINLGGNKSDSPLARRIYHTKLDTHENLNPQMFEIFGRSAELLIRSLDALDHSTDNSSYYLPIRDRKYLGRSGLLTLQIFLFLPLLLATSFEYYNLRARERFLRDVMIEIINIGLFILPWILVLLVLYLLVWTNFIPRYELYPATPLDPLLRRPLWRVVGIVAATFVMAGMSIHLVRVFFSLRGRPDFPSSKAVCLDMLLTMSVITLMINGFAASLFLAPAALLWIWIEQGRRPARRILNVVLLLAAAVPFVILIIVFSRSLMLGPYVFWYLLLGAGYKFFSPLTILIAGGTATVGLRLLRKSFVGAAPMPEPETNDNE